MLLQTLLITKRNQPAFQQIQPDILFCQQIFTDLNSPDSLLNDG